MDYVKKQAIFLIEKINLINKILKKEVNELNVGDWGFGIWNWSQSTIPNPQSPFY